jgi:hypothetical protein
VAQPEDLAGQLALATGQHEAPALELAVERLPVEVVRDDRGSDGLGGMSRIGEQLEAEGLQPCPRRRGARLVAGEDGIRRPRRSSVAGPRRPGRPRRWPG